MENYKLISLIGVGSYGHVYEAFSKDSKSTVALKIIGKRGRTNREIKNLRGECKIQSNLNHPNIIRMLNSFETLNEIIVITEFAQSDLHKLLTREISICESRAQKLTFDLVSALYYLHSHRILHRDLKPQNVLLDKDDNAKLCDFGLARNMTLGTHVLTSIKGTPLYMAPELLTEKPYDYLADLWSLGCIIYETVKGEPPFNTTSFLRLVNLIRNEHIKWPTYLTDDCVSFLRGLLEKDPAMRSTWSEILEHPFVKDRITILNDNNDQTMHPFSVPQKIEKEKNLNKKSSSKCQSGQNGVIENYFDDGVASSRDSISGILQSDLENLETDAEELYSNSNSLPEAAVATVPPVITYPSVAPITRGFPMNISFNQDACYLSDNCNLVLNNFNDNFQFNFNETTVASHGDGEGDGNSGGLTSQSTTIIPISTSATTVQSPTNQNPEKQRNPNRELEKRKLSQDLDNFSVRMGNKINNNNNTESLMSNLKTTESINNEQPTNKSKTIKDQREQQQQKSALQKMDDWDEYQNTPIENEEWIAFLYKSIQEVLNGEIESLQQKNLVSIIVAPLHNHKTSNRVVECVSQLLSLPLVLDVSQKNLQKIINIYIEVKLVPNLIYASKLLCKCNDNNKSSTIKGSTILENSSFTHSYKNIKQLTVDQLKTVQSMFELVCHLVHLNDQFLTHFCDAVAILGVSEIFVGILCFDSDDRIIVRLKASLLALLCKTLRDLPENAELVEKIIFHSDIEITSLLNNKNSLVKLRMCMLLRMIGRFSCRQLQTVWSKQLKESLITLINEQDDQIRHEATCIVDELQHLPFYNQ